MWDKPALACLSSRFPYGTEITPARLTQVARCERALRELGFRVFRGRYHGELARIEVGPDEIERLQAGDVLETLERRFRDAAFETVEVDPRGYSRGSLNEVSTSARAQ